MYRMCVDTNLGCIEFFSPIRGGYHMNDLIVSVISQFDAVPIVVFHQSLPFLFRYNWRIEKLELIIVKVCNNIVSQVGNCKKLG